MRDFAPDLCCAQVDLPSLVDQYNVFFRMDPLELPKPEIHLSAQLYLSLISAVTGWEPDPDVRNTAVADSITAPFCPNLLQPVPPPPPTTMPVSAVVQVVVLGHVVNGFFVPFISMNELDVYILHSYDVPKVVIHEYHVPKAEAADDNVRPITHETREFIGVRNMFDAIKVVFPQADPLIPFPKDEPPTPRPRDFISSWFPC